jgi:hypothetical protein
VRFEHGRPFNDTESREPVAVVSRSLANNLWPDGSAVGQRFKFQKTDSWLTVVGVVADVNMLAAERDRDPIEVFRPHAAVPGPGSANPDTFLVVKTDGRDSVAGMIRQQAAALDPNLPIESWTGAEMLRDTVAERELNTTILMGLSLFGLLLAGAGVYAIVAYEAGRRTHEIGIRVALGATSSNVIRVVMTRSLAMCAGGAALGAVASLVAAKGMASMVFGISPHDAATFAGAIAFLLTVAALAAYLPARHAARVDPLIALRQD